MAIEHKISTLSSNPSLLRRFLDEINDSSIKVYVRVDNPSSARFGSIGRLVPHQIPPLRRWSRSNARIKVLRSRTITGNKFDLVWDNGRRANNVSVRGLNLVYMPDYNGPQVYLFSRKSNTPKEKPPALDALGNTLEVGDFVVVSRVSQSYRASAFLSFGTIRKITFTNTFYVETIGLPESNKSRIVRIDKARSITKFNDDSLRDLMLLKLQQAF